MTSATRPDQSTTPKRPATSPTAPDNSSPSPARNTGLWRLLQTRPRVPLSRPALLTNAGNDPKLGEELRAELVTADRVDPLCAFVQLCTA